MTRNNDFFDQIDDYCLEQLSNSEKLEFEAELTLNPELNNEMELWMDIRQAVQEKEVLNLREELCKVAAQKNSILSGSESFDLLNEISDFQEITEILSPEELINYFDSLPKAHAYLHEASPKENTHHFYKEQNGHKVDDITEDFEDFDLLEFDGLEEAILEKDILQFRQTLKQVAESVQPQFNVEDIDEYLNNELAGDDLLDFESALFKNHALREEVKLQKGIDDALGEFDVIGLRDQISNILRSETSWNVTEQSIEDFVDGILEGDLLDEFNSEFGDNSDLQAEVTLRKQVNEAIGEKDIFDLRSKLNSARELSDSKKVTMIIPNTKSEQIRFWRNSVAIFILLVGLAGVFRNVIFTDDRMYESYYTTPSWSPERSVSSELSLLQQANAAYSNADYSNVILILNQLPTSAANNPVYQFYKAASLQNLQDYSKSIELYSMVIEQGDNLFVEEAKWYRSLCYLKIGNEETAKQELLAVIERKGHFENDAKALLRRLRYTMK